MVIHRSKKEDTMKFRKRLLVIASLGFALFLLVGAKGCEPENPPFDATGEYSGEWWSGEGAHCPLYASITMNAAPVYPPLWNPQATFTIDFSCIELPEGFPPLEPVDIKVGGQLDINGNLTFATGGCGVPYCILFGTAGVGADSDANGFMDTYTGTWSLVILLAGFEPFGVSGQFELRANEK